MPGFLVGKAKEGPYSKTNFMVTYTWTIPNIFGTKAADIANNDSKNAFILLKEATTPSFTIQKEQYTSASIEYKYAKSITYEDVKLSWYDTEGLIELMRRWRLTVWDSSSGIKAANSYKKDTVIQAFLQDGSNKSGWILRNSWPSAIKYGDLNYTSSDVKIVEVTVTYDWADEASINIKQNDFMV